MDRTDTSKIFHELVLNNHMIPFGQKDYTFSFKTVFHISKYLSYHCCPCAYEHENFDYISETGETNQEMFEKIAESVRTGACPHVDMVSGEYVTETKVGGIHVVAAVGSEERILCYLKNVSNEQSLPHLKCFPAITGKFTHTPYSIALLKNKAVVTNNEFEVFKQFLNKYKIPKDYELCSLINGTRDVKNSNKIKLKHESMVEISLWRQNMAMLKCILRTLLSIAKPSSIAKVYEVLYRQDTKHELLSEMFKLMMAKLQEVMKSFHAERHEELKFVAETLIVCNLPDHFAHLIKILVPKFKCVCRSEEENFTYNCFSCICKQTCKVLERPECERVIQYHCRNETSARLNEERSTSDLRDNNVFTGVKIRTLMFLLHDHPFSKNDLQEALGNTINLPRADGLTLLRRYMYEKLNIDAVKMLLQNGSDIDTTFSYLLERKNSGLWRNTEFEYRQILELFIFSNPSLDETKTVVAQGFENDATLLHRHTRPRLTLGLDCQNRPRGIVYHTSTVNRPDFCRQSEPWKYVCHEVLPGTYLMDATEHSFLYQDISDICLNFMAPLLIESGFPIQREKIEETLKKPLHPAVKAYLQQCLDAPRSLKSLCRDGLRKHFKGLEIHEYVRKLNIPEYVRDFILLKTILPTISHDEWNTVKLYKCEC